MKRDFNLYKELFLSTFSISAFTVGGGYVIVPLMKERFVEKLGWIDEEEMINMIAIAQSSPGAVAVNASIILGYKIGGVLGSICTILGSTLPPLIIISIISLFYNSFRDNRVVAAVLKGMQAGVAALIVNVVINMGKSVASKSKYFGVIIMALGFISAFIFNINVVIIILSAAILGAARSYYTHKKIGKLKESKRRVK